MGATSDGDRPWESYHTAYTNAKAGMDGVDKEKVQRVIYEMSKGSKYFENEQRKEAILKQKIERMQAQCVKLTAKDIAQFQTIADRRILELESSRDLSKIWLHSDMDAFYAAVETLENPSLKGKPLAVGSMSMICTADYEARKFGVRAAMPGFIAVKLCPNLVLVPVNFDKYVQYSEKTRKVFRRYDPNFIATSLDEAYLDITSICKDRGISSQEVAEELRNAVYEETGLTCSAGVAPNRLLAKVCSDINKPNGQYILPNELKAILTFVSSLPIRKIGGIGKVTEHVLRGVLGINTCEEMLKKSAYLCGIFSPSSVDFFLSVGLGLGNTETPQQRLRKSISSERTFSSTDNQSLIYKKLEEIAEALSDDMRKESLFGRTLTLKLKTLSFEVKTRATSLQKCIQSKEDIFLHATKLLRAELPLSLRLIGLRMSHFNEEDSNLADPTQKTLTSFISSRGAPGGTVSVDSLTDCKASFSDDISDHLEQVFLTNEDRKSTSSSQHGSVMWVNGYMCSLCGWELPPSFVEERQEHSDYHLAEMLQKESIETKTNQKSCVSGNAQKRRKSTASEDAVYWVDNQSGKGMMPAVTGPARTLRLNIERRRVPLLSSATAGTHILRPRLPPPERILQPTHQNTSQALLLALSLRIKASHGRLPHGPVFQVHPVFRAKEPAARRPDPFSLRRSPQSPLNLRYFSL